MRHFVNHIMCRFQNLNMKIESTQKLLIFPSWQDWRKIPNDQFQKNKIKIYIRMYCFRYLLRAIFNPSIKKCHKKAKLWINKYSKKSLSKKNKKEKTKRCKMISKKKIGLFFYCWLENAHLHNVIFQPTLAQCWR